MQKLACTLILCVLATPIFSQECVVYPISFVTHGEVLPAGEQEFWSVVENCGASNVKYVLHVKLNQNSQFVTDLGSFLLRVPAQSSVTHPVTFNVPSVLGNYTVVGTVTLQGGQDPLGSNSADFSVVSP